ncbi:A/G-specific adenine glycosylase [Lachnospiraceae bacterium TWA4]|nr:A/G-specific adenine glycosylase [Lachnospiraceae bacterium TWA4]
MEKDLQPIIPKECPGTYNQALMEIGALVCLPTKEPHCNECPMENICLSHKKNLTDVIPYKAPKKQRKIEKKRYYLLNMKIK